MKKENFLFARVIVVTTVIISKIVGMYYITYPARFFIEFPIVLLVSYTILIIMNKFLHK